MVATNALRSDGKHYCPHPTCEVLLPLELLGCRVHWNRLPRQLRNAVTHHWFNGTTAQYLEAREAAVQWWEEHP